MIPRTLFDADLEGFRDSVRKFLEQEAAPYHEQWEKDGQVSRELWRKAGELGFLCPMLPEEYGGVGADFRYSAVIMEEISRARFVRHWLGTALRYCGAVHPELRLGRAEAEVPAENGLR